MGSRQGRRAGLSAPRPARAEARQALARALREEPALAGYRIADILRDRPPVLVARLEGPGRALVAKLDRTADMGATAARLEAAAAALAGTPHGVARVALSLPERGLIVMPPLPGRKLAEMLDGPARSDALRAAGEWLAALTRARETGRFGPRHWLRVAAGDPGAPALPAIAGRILARLETLAPSLAGAPVVRARGHGDFTPDNLFLTESGAVHGLDLTGGPAAVALDVARMRAWLGSRQGSADRAADWAADRAALLSGGALAADQDGILSFLTGVMILRFMQTATHRPDRIASLAEAGAAWLRQG